MPKLIDPFGRHIDYLRISVTDRCNLRCLYCMPESGITHKPQEHILSFEEIYAIVRAAANLGITRVRVTGGEPLVRRDIVGLIRQLREIRALEEIALTTNGIYLSDYAVALKNAGLSRVNVSLDSLNPQKFSQITRGGALEKVRQGIEAACAAGLNPIKINVVLIKDFNTDEIPDFALLTRDRPWQVRFIEYMPTFRQREAAADKFFSCAEAHALCAGLGELTAIDKDSRTTARIFRIKGFCGSLGFISPLTMPFCSSCNKLRLTSDGFLRSCLYSNSALNLTEACQKNSPGQLTALIKKAAALKPLAHNLSSAARLRPGFRSARQGVEHENFSMCQIGG